MKRVTVYCGANVGNQAIYQKSTEKLGQWLVQNNYDLVYGGGKSGLMGILADTVLENKGVAIGIIPEFLREREIAHSNLTELHVVDDMDQRKRKMIELGECFIALPGGPGTLEEISEVISWARIGKNDYPCIFYNVNGYYDLLSAFYDKMVEEGFLTKEDREKTLVTDSLEEIQNFIQNYQPPKIRTY